MPVYRLKQSKTGFPMYGKIRIKGGEKNEKQIYILQGS